MALRARNAAFRKQRQVRPRENEGTELPSLSRHFLLVRPSQRTLADFPLLGFQKETALLANLILPLVGSKDADDSTRSALTV